jgi:hypothetical protein
LLANGGTYRAPRATGLTKGSLYKASKNKRDLFEKCLDLYMVRDSLRMVDRPPIETYARMLNLMIETVNNDAKRPCGCLATNVIRELAASDSALAKDASDGLGGMQEAMEFRLTWARNRGEFRQASPIAAAPLQDLDLVAVGVLNEVLNEEEARHQCAVALKLLDLTGLQPQRTQAARVPHGNCSRIRPDGHSHHHADRARYAPCLE